MNFLKNSFNKLFGVAPEQKEEKKQNKQEQHNDIPLEVLMQFFQMTTQFIKESKQPAPDSLKLQLYAYYKQATIGDCNTPKPSLLDFTAKAKWQSWNNVKGTDIDDAMKQYIATAIQVDPFIPQRMALAFNAEQEVKCEHQQPVLQRQGATMRMVQQHDYSSSYSHPYFKAIQKGEEVPSITRQLLLEKNNNPKVYPLHFAIDKQRQDLVPLFLQALSKQDIMEMRDEEGTGILQYAQLIQNQVILQQIRAKLCP